ncbi:MAG: FG-GAP-like repeat-containing protein, partial [Cyclobacteriaceae bacterium]|nr:FG-GAP-like repeat-containing protein [Cyclobacteriaceae bacterium]
MLPFLFIHCNGDKKNGGAQDGSDSQTTEAMQTARTLGIAYLEENRLDEAEEQFKKLVELAPDEALGYANLGVVYIRLNKYPEAEENLKKALSLDPNDPEIRLNLSLVYEMTNKPEESLDQLEKSADLAPDHVKTLYKLAEAYEGSLDQHSLEQWQNYLEQIVKASPDNIASRLHLIEALVRNGDTDAALAHLEEIERIYPDYPADAGEFYALAKTSLRASDTDKALNAVLVFHNILKLSNPYQSGIRELKGNTESTIGFPVITFSEAAPGFFDEGEAIYETIKFSDVTTAAGLNVLADGGHGESLQSHLAVGDIDRDGDQDLYLGGYDQQQGKYVHFLLKNEMGRFQNIIGESGINHTGNESGAIFTDYDNDGFFDLYVVREGENVMYRNISEGKYQDATSPSGTGDNAAVGKALFFDMDHEGDLDMYLAGNKANKVYRNKGDGSFESVKTGAEGAALDSRDVAFGDFDDDGDIDLFVVNANGSNALYSNVRQGTYDDLTKKSGLETSGGSGAVAVGDYNNDGFLDLFVTALSGGKPVLYRNDGKGVFTRDKKAGTLLSAAEKIEGLDAAFFDFDNDGFLDILLAGKPVKGAKKGVLLFHNTGGSGEFEDVSHLLPDDLVSGRQIAFFDYNEDGDMDIFLAGIEKGVHLLRNDGGNANHHLKVQLIGVRSGSSKNNYFGIGARLEVRAGDLYQVKVVTEPTVYFGLGRRAKADIVRVLWTNGTPQNIFSPGSDQDLIEEQQLKGSCPFLYAWDGEKFEFVKDMMWRSALGMPLGIMGGNTAYAFPDASQEYLKIPGDRLKPKDGKYALQITAELWETIYFDELKLMAIDHPDSHEIFVDEKFTPPPFPSLEIFTVEEKIIPVMAVNEMGNDVLPFLAAKDDRYISDFNKTEYQGVVALKDLILDPGKKVKEKGLSLFLNGWIFPTDASINMALSQRDDMQLVAPYLQVINAEGNWETVIENLGFPMGKNKTIITDLSGKYLSADRRVRIRTNMEIYWDHAFFAVNASAPVKSTVLKPLSADLHFRGYSRLYRKGGRYGPHWFDYQDVTTGQKWRDLDGDYTRYGDVLPLLSSADNKYIIKNAGDETSLTFDAEGLPALPEGWTRDFIIYSVGWVKDGDLNTAHGNTVGPLPYHG